VLKLALGPIQYYWPRATVLEFYEAVAGMPVDVVYLGETVCSRRHELRLSDWLAIAEQLAAAGKDVVLSTQALLESKTDMAMLQRITGNGRFMVEANDIGAAHLLAGKLPFVAGPYLNIYNAPTLRLIAELGAKRWVMPIEMSREGLLQVLHDEPGLLETEVFAYGRMPLAFSARCFTARHHNLPKDDCRFMCLKYPDGLVMKTREGDHFLALNGIQTQSALVYNLVREIAAMPAAGVNLVRISPQHQHMQHIVALFRAVLDADMQGDAALAEMEDLMPDDGCDGYWRGKPGLERIVV
jgi:O2-independent ubiquinone biosynthesis protein UbiV